MQRRLFAIVVAIGCIPVPPPRAADPDAMICHFADTLERPPLRWPGDERAHLTCDVANRTRDWEQICARPYVGVRATGVVHAAHPTQCSRWLWAGNSESFDVALDFDRRECNRTEETGGCILKVFGVNPRDADDVVAFARQLQTEAPHAGERQPTIAECEPLVDRWRAAPATFGPVAGARAATLLQCMDLPRAVFACLAGAKDKAALAACAPHDMTTRR